MMDEALGLTPYHRTLIVSHYEDLPWAHEGILSTHLQKIVRKWRYSDKF